GGTRGELRGPGLAAGAAIALDVELKPDEGPDPFALDPHAPSERAKDVMHVDDNSSAHLPAGDEIEDRARREHAEQVRRVDELREHLSFAPGELLEDRDDLGRYGPERYDFGEELCGLQPFDVGRRHLAVQHL